MASRKFNIGDKVRFTPRVCRWATEDMRRRTRRIVAIYYDHDKRCTYYQLGGRGGLNQWAENGYWFRSYELYKVNGNGDKIGRPTKRVLRQSGVKLLSASPKRQQPSLPPNQVSTIKKVSNPQTLGIQTQSQPFYGVSA